MIRNSRKKILITGCSGFLASHLLDALEKNSPHVLSGITEVPDFQSSRLKVFTVDLRDRDLVFSAIEEIQPDLVFHLAAISNVGFSWKNQDLTYKVNFLGSSNLIEAVSQFAPSCRILLMSSAELYGNLKEGAYSEADVICSPRNPYSLSKIAMELVGELYMHAGNMDIIKVRAFNFTGPGQAPQFVAPDFSRQIARIEAGLKEPVLRVGNLSAVRDFSDVRDIARYLAVLAEKGESGKVYNLCSGGSCSIQDILDILLDFATKDITVEVDPKKLRPVDVPFLWGDNSLIKDKFNLTPDYDIRHTLLDLLNDWRKKVGRDG
ncbi:MAG: NAD-dependent epimerase/dehydratase family protein [bacterium]|nr:NAD-dependent epimerase/dehydratase family protein [bacterium]